MLRVGHTILARVVIERTSRFHGPVLTSALENRLRVLPEVLLSLVVVAMLDNTAADIDFLLFQSDADVFVDFGALLGKLLSNI